MSTANDGKTFVLKHPLQVEDLQLDEIHLAEPRAKHLRALDREAGEGAKTLRLIAELSGLPIHVVDEIHLEDLNTVAGFLEPYLGKVPPTGGPS